MKHSDFTVDTIYNEDCFETMKVMPDGFCDVILTSPFYNTNKKAGKTRTLKNTSVKNGQYDYVRYDVHVDNMTNDEYCDYTVNLFNSFSRILSTGGVVLYNLSYGSENTECMVRAVSAVLERTDFTLADVIVWKKSNALPNCCSPNKLTRICEFVYVFCRRSELKTFNTNKKVLSQRANGQKMYEAFYNFIEAKNNDGACPYNKATYSSELCEKLLDMYAGSSAVVYDPFMGSGTTAVACIRKDLHYIGSEISPNQCEWARNRLSEMMHEEPPKTLSQWLDELLGGDTS